MPAPSLGVETCMANSPRSLVHLLEIVTIETEELQWFLLASPPFLQSLEVPQAFVERSSSF